MSTPEKWLDAEGLRYALHGEDNESVLDSDSGIIINAGHQEDAELLRDQLNSYESRLAEQKAAALSLRDELVKSEAMWLELCEQDILLKAELAEAKTALDEMIRLKELHISGGRFDAALVGDAVHIMAALMVQWFRDAGGPNYCGVGMKDAKTGEAFEMTLQRVEGDSPQVVAGKLRDELAECRAKLAAQIERCGLAELAESQRTLERDNALAKLAECVDKAAAIIGTGPEMASGPNHGVVLAALDWLVTTKAQASDMNANLARDNELLSRKLAQAEQERDKAKKACEMYSNLGGDLARSSLEALAAAQAENVRLREAGRDLRLMATTQAPADHPLIVAWDRANADHGSRDALRKILRSAAVEAGRNCIETTEQLDALVARLLGEEGDRS